MEFYEIIYENGAHSIAMYKDDKEALEGIEAHHQRALEGQFGGPAGTNYSAIRIKRVLVYNEHPCEYNPTSTLTKKELMEAVDDLAEKAAFGDLISINEFAAGIRELSSPLVISGPHESSYKMAEYRELEGSWLS